ncbi:MAG: hypothetical protein R3F48_03865 [Candidatus Zixiibacteriota bacterium]
MRKLVLMFCLGLILCLSATSLNADCGVCGDLTGDGNVDISDVTAFVNWYYRWPDPITPNCEQGADMNCDNSVQLWELDYLVDYLFNFGPAPCDPVEWPACAE